MSFPSALDFVGLPPLLPIGGLSTFTIECHFRLPTGSAGGYRTFLDTQQSGNGLRPVWIGVFDGKPRAELNWPGAGAAQFSIGATSDRRDDTWHHFAVIADGAQVSGYVDGVLAINGIYPGSLFVGSFPLMIGASINNGFDAAQMTGDVEEVRIWNVARTTAEVQSTMNVGLAGNEPGLVGYWRFDEGSGQTAFNSAVATGSALDGTLGANALTGTDDPTWLPSGAPLIYCPGCGLGSSNSAAASLQINGLGAVGVPGPFAITGASGSTLSLLWNGPPNQPLILAAGPPSAGCGVLSGFGTIDIGTPPAYLDVVFAFNGLVAPTSYFFVTNPAGLSAQTFFLPVLPGASLAVQGLVFQPPGVAAFGVLPTASFSIQF